MNDLFPNRFDLEERLQREPAALFFEVKTRAEYEAAFKAAISNNEMPKQDVAPIISALMSIGEGTLLLAEIEEEFDHTKHIFNVWKIISQGFMNS